MSNSAKTIITSKFKKSRFELSNAGRDIPVEDGDWEGIDEYIRPFLMDLNKSRNIMTLYSCEGHKENDDAYLFFNVNKIGWDIFWLKVMPALASAFCRPVILTSGADAILQLNWTVQVLDTARSEGIAIHCSLDKSDFRTWQQSKELFWSAMKESFLNNFK
jgi:hypothetical protein